MSDDALSPVRLRTGDEQPAVLVDSTVFALRNLLAERPFAFYDLVMACRDRSYHVFTPNRQHLLDLSLVEGIDADGRATIHGAVRSITLAATTGFNADLRLVSPLAGPWVVTDQ